MFSLLVTPRSQQRSSSSSLPYLVPSTTECPMFSIPAEIVQEIGSNLPQDCLIAFSATSRGLRDALLPLIVKDVSISTMSKLKRLTEYSPYLLGLIRNLDLTLNIDFFDAWTHEVDSPLATVLSKCPNLQSLIFQASNSPYDTPWNRFNVGDTALRGISLGLESLPDASLPMFERLQHLELQTISTDSLEILLSRSPNLRSLNLTLPDGLSHTETSAFVQSLRHVPTIQELTVSIAEWETSEAKPSLQAVEALKEIAIRLPQLEKLDMRARSYDMIDGILAYKCVDVDYETYLDIASVLPCFSVLKELYLPLQSHLGDATIPSTELARVIPMLSSVSWMDCVAFQGHTDEYAVHRNSSADVSVTRLNAPALAPASSSHTTITRRRGFALFDSLFDSFISADKPSFMSDVLVSLSALMVVSSMFFSPVLVLVGF